MEGCQEIERACDSAWVGDCGRAVAQDTMTGRGASPGARFALTKFRPTKLPPTLVRRSGLHERPTEGADKRLTVVVGSAGVGKSVLLADAAGVPYLGWVIRLGPHLGRRGTPHAPAPARHHVARRRAMGDRARPSTHSASHRRGGQGPSSYGASALPTSRQVRSSSCPAKRLMMRFGTNAPRTEEG